MKKLLLLFSLFCIAITGARADNSTDDGYYYDPESPLIGDPAQMNANSIDIGASGGEANMFLNLLDGNTNTIFHSYWDRATFSSPTLTAESYKEHVDKLDPNKFRLTGIGWTNLQIKLYDPVQVFFFTFTGRNSGKYCDFPNDIIIYATNDDALGASVLSTESEKWDKVTELKEGFPSAVALAKYSSPAIVMSKPYKYIRFEVRNTVTSDDGGTGVRPCTRPEVTGRVWNLAEFQMYEGVKIEGYRSRLDSLINAIDAGSLHYEGGVDPGYYYKSKTDAYDSVYQDAKDKYVLDLNDAECKALYDNLYAALNDVLASGRVPMEDGYYNIVSAWSIFREKQGVDKAWYYDATQNALMWTTYDKRQPLQLFKLEKQADGRYAVSNVVSGKYLYHLPYNGVPVPFSDSFESGQVLEPFAAKPYEFKIYSPDFDSQYNKYNTRQHNSGAGVTGQVSAWDSDMDSEATWFLKRVDGTLLDSLLNVSGRDKAQEGLRMAINEAQSLYDKCYDYKSIFTDATQMTVNSQNPSDGSIAALLDNNVNTYFHSDWQQAFKQQMTGGTGWHNMQFALSEAVDKVKFYYFGRINSSGYVDDPDHITLYATNDDALGASTAAADSTSWTEIADLTKPRYDFPAKNLSGSSYTSPVIDLGGSYKYLRFVVKHTNGQGTMASRTFYDPSVSGVTFELSEFRLWDGNPEASSQASHIEGMEAACAALLVQMNQGRDKLVAGTATEADVTALKSAMAAVSALYINRDSLDAALSAALKEAQTVYDEQTGSKVSILNSADQLSTNNVDCGSSGANSVPEALAHLLDGNINTVFHSYWNRSAFSAEKVDAGEYSDLIKSLSGHGVEVNGLGYHNLQVRLENPRSSFYFTYIGRNDATFHDNPNDIVILATNDDVLGASTLDSESSQWDYITELNENMPENVQTAQYESPLIDMGSEYKYIRFVIKSNTRMSDRPTTAPDITGIVYNLSELRMYSGEDPSTLPYSHSAELKEAVDALQPLITEYSTIEPHSLFTTEPIEKLKAAIAKVNSFTVDTTEMVTLYNSYAERIGNSVAGEGIGYVDQQSNIDAFAEALVAARASVKAPTKVAVDKAVKAMKDAYATFMTHVEQIKPGTWYNIISLSVREVFTGQPIHLSPALHGNDLRVGDMNLEKETPRTNPYALWRFVQVEGAPDNYYIQNLGTGQYIGGFSDNLATMQVGSEPVAYRLIYFGDGGFRITQAANPDDKLAFKTDKSRRVILTYPLNSDNQQVFTFDEVTPEEEMAVSDYRNNSIQIVTLPYAAKGESSISALNGDKAAAYAVKSLTATDSGTRLELTKITDVDAGVPFILVVGDYTQPAGDSIALQFAVPETVTDSATTANGLVGTIMGTSVTQQGLGMFLNNSLYATTSYTTPFAARSGYINPALVRAAEGNTDLVIESTDLINAITAPTADRTKATGKVNVYTIEGTLLKRGVDEAEALRSLPKGIYIVGHKKVYVK